jgi:hypothetical protein
VGVKQLTARKKTRDPYWNKAKSCPDGIINTDYTNLKGDINNNGAYLSTIRHPSGVNKSDSEHP